MEGLDLFLFTFRWIPDAAMPNSYLSKKRGGWGGGKGDFSHALLQLKQREPQDTELVSDTAESRAQVSKAHLFFTLSFFPLGPWQAFLGVMKNCTLGIIMALEACPVWLQMEAVL